MTVSSLLLDFEQVSLLLDFEQVSLLLDFEKKERGDILASMLLFSGLERERYKVGR